MEELMTKISEAMNETFVGNYIFSDEELEQLYEFTSYVLRKYDKRGENRISHQFDTAFFIAMTNAIKDWNSDEETVWDYIYDKLIGTSGSPKIYTYLKGVIDRLSRQGKIMCLSGGKRYHATLAAHAFSPLHSTQSFLELCWNLYSKDMNLTYIKNNDIYSLAAEKLKHIFSQEKSYNDDLKLGGGIYSFRVGIKRMAIDRPEEMKKHIEKTIALLDKAFNGESFEEDLYYNRIVRNWWAEKEKSFGISKPTRKAYKRVISDYSRIRPEYRCNGNQTILTIPSIRLKNFFYDIPLLHVYCNGKIIIKRQMDTFGSGLTIATKELVLCADDLVSEDGEIACTLEIMYCGEVIYNSKSDLFRKYILFKNNREITKNECLPGNYRLFAPKWKEFSEYPEDTQRIPSEKNLFTMNSKDAERVQTTKRTVFFSFEPQKRSIRIVANTTNNAKFIRSGEEFAVIDGELQVYIKSDADTTECGVCNESGTFFRLNEFECEEQDDYKIFSITELLNIGELQKIAVFRYADNVIEASYNVVKFNRIQIDYDKKMYFDENNIGSVHFRTERHDKSVSFDINKGDIIIPLDNGDLILSPPTLRWKIEDGAFSTQYGKDLWYKNYSNAAELVVDLPSQKGCQAVLDNNIVLPISQSLNSLTSFKLGEKILSMMQNDKKEVPVTVNVEDIGVVPILTICLKEKFRSTPFFIYDKSLVWNAGRTFVGDATSKFKISFYKSNVCKHSFTIDDFIYKGYNSKRFSLYDLETGIYDVTVDLMKRVGLTEQAVRVYEQQVVLSDIDNTRFKGKYLLVTKAMLTGQVSYRKIIPFYIEHIRYIGESEDGRYYTGRAYTIERGRKRYLDTMPNSDKVPERTNPIRIEFRSKNSCFIVAGVKLDNISEFLGEFTLDSKNRISNYDTEPNGTKTRGIDYFLFETKEVK